MTAPLILVPGTLCDERVFAPMIALMKPGARSTPPIVHGRVEAAAEALLATAPDRFIAGGFSLGGFVVLELLRRAPERLAGAVLIASNAFPLGEDQAPARRGEVDFARRSGPGALIQALWPRYVVVRNQENAMLRQLVTDMAEAVGVDTFARQADLAVTRPDSCAIVRETPVPLLMLCGAEDAMCPPGRCSGMTGPTTTLKVLPGVGHFIPLEAPREAASAIEAWVQEVAPCC